MGQLLIAGFNGQQIPAELRSLAREFSLGGVIFFARNVADPEQVAELAFDASRLVPELPVWVSVDQEGGRVARLKAPFTEWPPMATLGRSGDVRLAIRFARALAEELKAVGVTLDYTPVLDILTNPKNPVIGDRALGEKAEDVARLGSAIITTLQGEGLAACGKHFPGHGDTSTDSHFELPLVDHPPDRLRRVEFVPFRAAIAAGVATMMTAHVFVPALDEKRPASLSKRIVGDLLRDELSYEGVILSDDLEMKAIANEYAVPAAAVLALEAGCDGVLICSGDHDTQAAAIEALVHAVEEDRLPLTRVDDALARQRRAKERFLALPVAARPLSGRALRSALGRDENRAVAEEMSRYL
ncbi:MAG: beta-N-acetylhexosaminidase [Acidobacteria bacterium]|nr:MAG: beta-N-acetylhexosaminidase [Acidobacteriota bacterium]PYR28202.1 MAG: beta-N-acetylhexosaminidase [Acidobacteriota bacterium]